MLKNKYETFISKASQNDSVAIWNWRNNEHTRLMSQTTGEVSWDSHNSWFTNSLQNVNCYLYIGKLANKSKVATCRFDIDAINKTAEVSINLNPVFRGKKISVKFLKKAIKLFCKSNKVDLKATIKKINAASIKCFIRCNFIFVSEDETYNYYRLQMIQGDEIQNKLKLIDKIEKIRTANNMI